MIDNEKPAAKFYEELNSKWEKIIDALKRVEYSYTINSVLRDDDDFKSPDGQPIKLAYYSASIIFNGFDSSHLYKISLMNLLDTFKNDFLYYVDDSNFLTSERLDFFLTKKQDIRQIAKVYPKDSKDNIFSGRSYVVLNVDNDWEIKSEEYLSFKQIIDDAMLPFVKIQNEFLTIVLETLDDVVAYIAVRNENENILKVGHKLSFNLQMSELVIFLLALREADIITGSSDADLSRFAQKNLMWKNNQLRGVQSKISEYRGGTISSKSSFDSLMLKLEKLKLPVKK